MASSWVLSSCMLLIVLAFVRSKIGCLAYVFPDPAPIPPQLLDGMHHIHERYFYSHRDCRYECRKNKQLSGGCVYDEVMNNCACLCYLRADGPNETTWGQVTDIDLVSNDCPFPAPRLSEEFRLVNLEDICHKKCLSYCENRGQSGSGGCVEAPEKYGPDRICQCYTLKPGDLLATSYVRFVDKKYNES